MQQMPALADFSDFFRPIQSYFYWEKHCYDIPVCFAIRSIFDTLDGVDDLDEKLHDLLKDLDKLDALLPQLLEQFPAIIENLQRTLQFMLTNHSTMAGMLNRWARRRTRPARWVKRSTPPRTTTRSGYLRRFSRTLTSSAR